MYFLIRLLAYIWALPNTTIGLIVGSVGLLTGGTCEYHRGCIEFSGGFVTWALSKIPPHGVLAMTLGHSIVGLTKEGLADARDHEQVHVRQYERWGPFFIPAYLLCSAYLSLTKRDGYRDNPFEVEAYNIADPSVTRTLKSEAQNWARYEIEISSHTARVFNLARKFKCRFRVLDFRIKGANHALYVDERIVMLKQKQIRNIRRLDPQ
jgi:hypothetical protein